MEHPLRPGTAALAFERQGGATVVSRALARSPLRLLMPRNHGRAAWVYTSSYGGGLVGGDALSVTVQVGPGAAAVLATQSATKIYRSEHGVSQRLLASVAAGGLLALIPEPVSCFAGSRLTQRQEIRLEEGASLVLVDAVTAGRHAAGERWELDHYHGRIDVWLGERRVLADSVLLTGRHGAIASRMGRFNVLCTLVLLGPTAADASRRLLAAIGAEPPTRSQEPLVTASPLMAGTVGAGAVVRLAGASSESVGLAVRRYLEFLVPLLGDDPWSRRW